MTCRHVAELHTDAAPPTAATFDVVVSAGTVVWIPHLCLYPSALRSGQWWSLEVTAVVPGA